MMETAEKLIGILENELEVGEQLLTNLAGQAQAFLGWNISDLIRELENKELLLFKLGEITAQRHCIVEAVSGSAKGQNFSLSDYIAGFPSEVGQSRLRQLQKRLAATYQRLALEETVLLGLIGDLLGHFKQALQTLVYSTIPLYGNKGNLTSHGPDRGLIHGKV